MMNNIIYQHGKSLVSDLFHLVFKPSQGFGRQLCIVAHGYGANEKDLVFLRESLVASDTTYIFARAPEACGLGYQWFPLYYGADSVVDMARAREDGARAAQRYASFVQEMQNQYSVSPERTTLMGFSQGAIISLEAALAGSSYLASRVVSFSGTFLGDVRQTKPCVLLVHGEADPVIPCQASIETLPRLLQAGVAAQLVVVPAMGHTIDREAIQAAASFIVG